MEHIVFLILFDDYGIPASWRYLAISILLIVSLKFYDTQNLAVVLFGVLLLLWGITGFYAIDIYNSKNLSRYGTEIQQTNFQNCRKRMEKEDKHSFHDLPYRELKDTLNKCKQSDTEKKLNK